MLRVARQVGDELGIQVRATFLGAHALPPEFAGNADGYIDAVVDWLPRLHAEGLVEAVDAFCERIGFTLAQTRRVFEAARTPGLPVKLHAAHIRDGAGAAQVAAFGRLSDAPAAPTPVARCPARAGAATSARNNCVVG